MRSRLLMSLLTLAALILPSQTLQAQVAETASAEMINDALKGLGVQVTQEGDRFSFTLNNRSLDLYRLGGGRSVLIKVAINKQPSLATLNLYNEQFAITTRAVRYQKEGTIFESGLDCQLGVTTAGLKKYVARFGAELATFEKFIATTAVADTEKTPGGKAKVPMAVKPGSDDKEFIITFPTNDPKKWETAWKIEWDMETAKQANEQQFKFPGQRANALVLFKIKKAFFKPGQKAEWIQVLEDAHPSEFYVPYYFQVANTRFFDLLNHGGYVPLSPKEGGAVSQTMGKASRVMAELRDRGVVYKHYNITRRGEELTLWANFTAANYTYMVEFGFHDDGTIVFRHAPTGYNFYPHFDATHMHGSYWRLGVKLGPEGNNQTNQVHVTRLPIDPKQQGVKGKIQMEELTKESFVDWSPREFTRIRVTNPNYSVVPAAKDRPALPISYDLVTSVQGIARHERFGDEKFTHHDFWITRHDCPEKMYIKLGNYFFPRGQPNADLKELNKENVVLWHCSAGLHVPRAEDGIVFGNNPKNGQATVYWTTFELRPRNLFLKTPIYRALP